MGEIRGNRVLRVARKLGFQVRAPKRRKHYVILDGPRIVTTVPKEESRRAPWRRLSKTLGLPGRSSIGFCSSLRARVCSPKSGNLTACPQPP